MFNGFKCIINLYNEYIYTHTHTYTNSHTYAIVMYCYMISFIIERVYLFVVKTYIGAS